MMNRREIAEQFKAAQEAATEGEWWVLPEDDDSDGRFHVLVGEQEDRVCEIHPGECKPAENADFIALARNSPIASVLLEAEDEIERLTLENARLKAGGTHGSATLKAAIRLLSSDMHSRSSRPCDTCRFVSNALNEPFGCVKFNQERGRG